MKKFLPILLSIFSLSAVSAQVIRAGVHEITPVSIVAEWPINSGTQIGEHFSARVVEDLYDSAGEIFIPKNSRIVGRVADTESSKTFHRNAKVDIQFEKIIFPDNIQTIDIEASGLMQKNKFAAIKILGQGTAETLKGAGVGALASVKFAGIVGASSSYGTTLAIGAATGGGLALISFISQKGEDVKIYPGLPMTLQVESLEEQDFKEQHMTKLASGVEAKVIKCKDNKLSLSITNNSDQEIPLSNLKIIDGLGYTVSAIHNFKYHDSKSIPAKSNLEYECEFPSRSESTRKWLVLSDSFNKQEYFRVEF